MPFWNLLTLDTAEIPTKVQFVLDGGSLLQHIPCMETRGHIWRYMYSVVSVHRLCSKKVWEAIVLFDGYGRLSTKDMAHQRRVKGHAVVAVTFI